MTRQVNAAIIGVGYWGKNYVRIFSELKDEAKLVCVCDLIPAAVEAFKAQYPGLNTSTSVSDMLARFPEIEVVVVVTPATTHFDVVKECLEKKKHVLCEKPLTVDPKQGEQLVEIAKQNDSLLMVGHTFLFNKGIHKMKDLMQDAKFGKPYYMYAKRHALGPIRQDVGADWDLIPHDISIIQYLLNNERPSSISAVGNNVLKGNNGLVDNAFVTISYPSGVIANIQASWVDPEKVRQFVVVGSGRRIVFDDTNAKERVKYVDNGAVEVSNEGKAEKDQPLKTQIKINSDSTYQVAEIEPFEPLKDQVRHFLSCVVEKKQPSSDGQFGVVVVEIMQAIVESIKNSGAPVPLK